MTVIITFQNHKDTTLFRVVLNGNGRTPTIVEVAAPDMLGDMRWVPANGAMDPYEVVRRALVHLAADILCNSAGKYKGPNITIDLGVVSSDR